MHHALEFISKIIDDLGLKELNTYSLQNRTAPQHPVGLTASLRIS